MSFGTSEAAVYDVKYQVNVGEFVGDSKTIESVWERTTGSMSDSSLRAAVAQEKLYRAIKLHGPSSLAAKSATLAYRKEMQALADQALVTGRDLDVAGRGATNMGTHLHAAEADAERFGRGMLSASGLLHGFGRAAVFASSTFLGGAGLVFALKEVIDASQKEELSLALVKNALRDTGNSWGQYGKQISDASDELVKHTAYSKEDVNTTLANLIRRTGNVPEAIDLTESAANLARGRNNTIDLATAGNVLIRALNGQTSALSRMGIQVTKVTAAQDALRASGVKASAAQLAAAKASDAQATQEALLASVKAKYGNAAAAYLGTEAGKQAELNAQLKSSEAIIGGALEPAYVSLLTAGAKRLEQMQKDGSLQRDVNHAVKDATQFVHDLEDAYHRLAPPIETVIGALGGFEKAVQTALVLYLAVKAKSAATSLGLIGQASSRARTQIVTDAAAEEAALADLALQAEKTSGVVGRIGAYTGAGGAGGTVVPTSGAKPGLGNGAYIVGALFGAQSDIVANAPNDHPAANETTLIGNFKLGAQIQIDGKPYTVTRKDSNYSYATPGYTAAGKSSGGPGWSGIAPAVQQAAAGPGWSGIAPAVKGATHIPKPPPPTVGLSFQTQKALVDAQISGSQSAQVAADKRAEIEIEGLLKQGGLTHADILNLEGQLEQYVGDERSIDASIAAAAQQAAAKRRAQEAAAKAAARAAAAKKAATYRKGISTDILGIQTDALHETRAGQHQVRAVVGKGGQIVIVGPSAADVAVPEADRRLVEEYKKEAHDKNLSANERAKYAKLAAEAEERDTKAIEAENKRRATLVTRKKKAYNQHLQQERDLAQARIQNAISLAQLHETQAGTNDSKVKKAVAEEIAANEALLRLYEKQAKSETGLAKQQTIAEEIAVRETIAQLKQQTATSTDLGANESQFLSSFASIVKSYAPNAFPEAPVSSGGKADTRLYELVHESRQTNQHLKDIKRTARFPGSRGAEAAINAAYG